MVRVVLIGLWSWLILVSPGCGRVRFVVDAVPAADQLTETVVMEDPGRGFIDWRAPKVALVDLTGLIIDAQRPGILTPGENPVGRFVESLRRAEGDAAVKAIVIRINSPGGTVTASDVLYHEIRHFKARTGKPVVISMGDVAASGGYYIACAGDLLIAHPTTVTGSIGVMLQTINVSEGLKKIGVRAEAITSGRNKAMGSPLEPMAEEHRALLQELVDEFYRNFEAVVAASRPNLSPDDLKWISDGRVVTGERAADVGLIDRLGDLRGAFEAAKELAGISTARLVKYHRPLEHTGSAYAYSPAPSAQITLMQLNVAVPGYDQPNFYYLWDPAIQ